MNLPSFQSQNRFYADRDKCECARDDESELYYTFSWEMGNVAKYKFLAKARVAHKAQNL